MADVFNKTKRSQVMSRIRSSGNRDTEIRMVKFFRLNRIKGWRRGQKLPGKPDFAFPSLRVVVFVDGCFWHGCPRHGRIPGSNVRYWREKLEGNKKRDRQSGRILKAMGWRVLRIWEHDLTRIRQPVVLQKIRRMLGKCGKKARS